MKNLTIQEHGLMLNDYFHGTSGVWINIYVTPKTTKKEVIEQLEQEINAIYEHIEYSAEYNGYDIQNLEKELSDNIEAMKDFIKADKDKVCFPDMEYDDDERAENAVLIFTIEFED